MEKRSRRRIRDLVALAAFQGLSENEIGCARISMMASSDAASFKGRIQKRKTSVSRSPNPACNARPVHTKVPNPDIPGRRSRRQSGCGGGAYCRGAVSDADSPNQLVGVKLPTPGSRVQALTKTETLCLFSQARQVA
jgi:hypothetical protein